MALDKEHPGDGSKTTFDITFPYLEVEDIKVAVKPSGGSYADKVLGTDYTVSNMQVVFGSAPANNSTIRIRRSTKITSPRHVHYAGSSLTAGSLNDNNRQLLYAMEERGLTGDDTGAVEFDTGTKGDIYIHSSTNVTLNNDVVDNAALADNSVGTDQYIDSSIKTVHIDDDQVTADKLANSINAEIAANTAKVTNATHTGEVTGATALTIANNVVDEDNLKISNSAADGKFLQYKDNTDKLTWATVSTTGNLMRQVQFINGPSSQVYSGTGTSNGWVTILQLPITTTTNDARVLVQIGGKPKGAFYEWWAFEVGLFRDSTELYKCKDEVAGNEDSYYSVSGITWVDSPGNAGTYTYYYKFQQTATSGSSQSSIAANYATMTLTELGPNPS